MTVRSQLSPLLIELGKAGLSGLDPTELVTLRAYLGLPFAFNDRERAAERGADWSKDRVVRADLIRLLCTSKLARSYADPHGVVVYGARVTGALDLSGVSVPFPITLQNCYFDEAPRFYQAEVRELNLDDSVVSGLNATLLVAKGNVSLRGLTCERGMVRLGLSQITGDLDCSGSTLSNTSRVNPDGLLDEESGVALLADQSIINGAVRLSSLGSKPFSANGAVSLVGAQVKGDLDCFGGMFAYAPTRESSEVGLSLNAERAVIKGAVFLNGSFDSRGEVRFVDAQIGASLFCEGGHFRSNYQPNHAQDMPPIGSAALQLDRASISGTARFLNYDDNCSTRQLQIVGRMSLVDARVGGVLEFNGSNLTRASLDLSGATASGLSDWAPHTSSHPWPSTWPLKDHLHLKRFIYGAIVGGTQDPEERLHWLGLQPPDDFNSDSYAQLASVLLQAGDDDGSRRVLEELKKLERQNDLSLWALRPNYWGWALIRQGYHPELAVWYSAFLALLGWIIYRRSYLAGSLVPTDKDAYSKLRDEGKPPQSYTHLSTLMLSVETSLPLVKLGQADKWQPGSLEPPARPFSLSGAFVQRPDYTGGKPIPKHTRAQLFAPLRLALGLEPEAGGRSVNTPLSRAGTSPGFVRGFMWVQILLGWLLATFFLYGLSDLIKK